MPSFDERPLSWLFLLALACLNAVALATDYQHSAYGSLLVAQTFIAAGWMVLGRAHRLARAAALLAVSFATATPDYIFDAGELEIWRYVLGSIIALGAAAVVGATAVVLAVDRRSLRAALRGGWRFTVAELLGWMILVAAASLIGPAAVFRHLRMPDSHWTILAAAGAGAGVMMALFLHRGRRSDPLSAAAAMVVTAAVLIYIHRRFNDFPSVRTLLESYAVVVAWIVVQRLDDARVAELAAAAETPPLRVFQPAPPSDDEQRRSG